MYDALAKRANVLRPNMRLLDIGAGHGFLDAYIAARHNLSITAYDVRNSYQCAEILASPLHINFFDGSLTPLIPNDTNTPYHPTTNKTPAPLHFRERRLFADRTRQLRRRVFYVGFAPCR